MLRDFRIRMLIYFTYSCVQKKMTRRHQHVLHDNLMGGRQLLAGSAYVRRCDQWIEFIVKTSENLEIGKSMAIC